MEVLDNLVRIHQLKTEPADAAEFAGMLRAGNIKLKDAERGSRINLNNALRLRAIRYVLAAA